MLVDLCIAATLFLIFRLQSWVSRISKISPPNEVALWLTAQGIDASKAIEEKVDGDLLLSLTAEDFKSDLGLSGLQSKKIMKNIEFSKVRDVLFMIISYVHISCS